MKKKPISKRQAGKQLNDEGRISPLEVLQAQMESFHKLAAAEMARGVTADPVALAEYQKRARDCAVELAPYRHPKLAATATMAGTVSDLEKFLQEIEAADRGPLPSSAVSGMFGEVDSSDLEAALILVPSKSDTQH